MSLDTVVEDVRSEAEERAAEIREAAEDEAAEIVAEAEAEAEEIREERSAAVEREIEQEREQRLSSAKLEAKQERLEARRDVLDDVRAAAAEAIADLSGDRREELTRELLEAGLEEFDESDTVRVLGRPEDEDLLSDLAGEFDRCEYAGETECLGGVVLESETSRIRVDNTFDSVLDAVWEDELRSISGELFEDELATDGGETAPDGGESTANESESES